VPVTTSTLPLLLNTTLSPAVPLSVIFWRSAAMRSVLRRGRFGGEGGTAGDMADTDDGDSAAGGRDCREGPGDGADGGRSGAGGFECRWPVSISNVGTEAFRPLNRWAINDAPWCLMRGKGPACVVAAQRMRFQRKQSSDTKRPRVRAAGAYSPILIFPKSHALAHKLKRNFYGMATSDLSLCDSRHAKSACKVSLLSKSWRNKHFATGNLFGLTLQLSHRYCKDRLAC